MTINELIKQLEYARDNGSGELTVKVELWDKPPTDAPLSGEMRPYASIKSVCLDPLPEDAKPERLEIWITFNEQEHCYE